MRPVHHARAKMTDAAAKLPAATSIGRVHLRVADVVRSAAFYIERLGFRELERSADTLLLAGGAGAPPIIELSSHGSTTQRPGSAFGIYHYAILYPDRASLAAAVRDLAASRWPFTGFADHGVSEAAYLDDPDGIGVELYVDRPRDVWPHDGDTLVLYTRPLDVEDLLRQADRFDLSSPPPHIGHIHLHVRDLAASSDFFEKLGMDFIAGIPGARFLSTGGYHHHVGINTWARQDAPRDAAGLIDWELVVPRDGIDALAERLREAGIAFDARDGGAHVQDPDGNAIRITTGT